VATSAEALLPDAHRTAATGASDVRLPGATAAVDDIRAQHLFLPVVGPRTAPFPDAIEATERGVFTHLTKPFDGKSLLGKMPRHWP
jgi:two-component system response regulator GlrR